MPEQTAPPPRITLTRGARRGVFAQRTFAAGEVIERPPVLVIPEAQRNVAARTDLVHYLCEWPYRGADVALPLGWGAMYKHAAEPSARVQKRLAQSVLEIIALRHIALGEEITIDLRTLSPVVPT